MVLILQTKYIIKLTLLLGDGDEASLLLRIPLLGDPEGEYMEGMDPDGESWLVKSGFAARCAFGEL